MISIKKAVEEAKLVIKNLKNYEVTFPVVFNTEYTQNGRANIMPNSVRTACAKAFCDTVEAAGYKSAIYSNTTWSILDLNKEDLEAYDMWYAFYSSTD